MCEYELYEQKIEEIRKKGGNGQAVERIVFMNKVEG